MKQNVEQIKDKITNEPKDASKELSERNRGVHIQGLNQSVVVVSDSPEDNLNQSCNVAYCVSLESALQSLYDEMIVDYVNRVNGYGGKFLDLANAIMVTKREISALLEVPLIKKLKEKGEN